MKFKKFFAPYKRVVDKRHNVFLGFEIGWARFRSFVVMQIPEF